MRNRHAIHHVLAGVLALILLVGLSACNGSEAPVETATATPEPTTSEVPVESEPPSMSLEEPEDSPAEPDSSGINILIAYFSREGNSHGGADAVSSASLPVGNVPQIARIIETETGGELFAITTLEPYPEDYRETTDQATAELEGGARPELTSHLDSLGDYDVVILGYPNWWGTIPMPVAAFLEEYDFTGKTILPFCLHEGSRLGSSVSEIASLCPGATVLEGLAVRTGDVDTAESDVLAWLDELGYCKR